MNLLARARTFARESRPTSPLLGHEGWVEVQAAALGGAAVLFVADVDTAVPVALADLPRFTVEELRLIGREGPERWTADRLRDVTAAKVVFGPGARVLAAGEACSGG